MIKQLDAAASTAPTMVDTPETTSDIEVVRRVLAGDGASFELLMRRYNQRIFRIVRSIVLDDDEAEDIVQDSYVRAFQHLSQFKERAKFSTWLSRIAINEALTRQRRRKAIQYMDFSHPEQLGVELHAAAHGLSDHQACNNELRTVLIQAIDNLPDELRTVFTLRVIEELDTIDTAACLGITESNVKVRLHRARRLLQQKIDERIGASVRQVYQFDGPRCDRIVNAVLERLRSQFGI